MTSAADHPPATLPATAPPSPSLASFLSTHPDYRSPSSSSSPLPSLYSSLSSLRLSNPAAYRANLEWWTSILGQVAWKGVQRDSTIITTTSSSKGKEREVDRLVLHVDEEMLQSWTVEEIGRPMGIGTVVLDMASTSHLVRLQDFLSAATPIAGPSRGSTSSSSSSSLRSYIPSSRAVVGFVVGRPLWWALSNLGIAGGGDAREEDDEDDSREWRKARGKWVVWDNVDRTATSFLGLHYSQATLSPLESLLPVATFRTRLLAAQPHLTDTDVQVVLKHLCRDRRVAQVEKGLVKLASHEGKQVERITEQDRGLVAIKETHDRLEKQIEELQRRMAECDTKIQSHLRSSQKPQALNSLKMKKHLSTILSKRLDSLSTLSSILLKIEQTAGDASIMATYETATKVLGTLLADPRLQRERVESTMDGLEQVVADQKEIDEAVMDGNERIRRAGGIEGSDLEADEEALEEEMKRLEEEEEREKKEAAVLAAAAAAAAAEQVERRRKEAEKEEAEKRRKLAREEAEKEGEKKKMKEEQQQQQQHEQQQHQRATAIIAPRETWEEASKKEDDAVERGLEHVGLELDKELVTTS